MPKNIYPDTSKSARDSLSEEHITVTHERILWALGIIKEGNFEAIASQMCVEPSIVWKRLSELCKDKKIHRPGHKTPTKSGRNAFVWKLGSGDNVSKVYEKGTQTAADIAEKIIAHSTNKLIQKDLFEWDFPENNDIPKSVG